MPLCLVRRLLLDISADEKRFELGIAFTNAVDSAVTRTEHQNGLQQRGDTMLRRHRRELEDPNFNLEIQVEVSSDILRNSR